MKKNILKLFVIVFISWTSVSHAGTISWIDWVSNTSGSSTIGSTNVGVSLTGNAMGAVNGDSYYNNIYTGFTSPTGTYGGLMPSDLIRVSGTGLFSLTFDTPVVDPYLALVSVGASSRPVTYSFNDPFSVISSGNNYWGYGGYTMNGNNFAGSEYNGILKFSGTYSSISFSISPNEYWHGFNFGVTDIATVVPEPVSSTLFIFGGVTMGFRLYRKRRRGI